MDLFRITGLAIEPSPPGTTPDFKQRYGWRQATARWLGESTASAREAVAACCRAATPAPCRAKG